MYIIADAVKFGEKVTGHSPTDEQVAEAVRRVNEQIVKMAMRDYTQAQLDIAVVDVILEGLTPDEQQMITKEYECKLNITNHE